MGSKARAFTKGINFIFETFDRARPWLDIESDNDFPNVLLEIHPVDGQCHNVSTFQRAVDGPTVPRIHLVGRHRDARISIFEQNSNGLRENGWDPKLSIF